MWGVSVSLQPLRGAARETHCLPQPLRRLGRAARFVKTFYVRSRWLPLDLTSSRGRRSCDRVWVAAAACRLLWFSRRGGGGRCGNWDHWGTGEETGASLFLLILFFLQYLSFLDVSPPSSLSTLLSLLASPPILRNDALHKHLRVFYLVGGCKNTYTHKYIDTHIHT